MKDRQLFILILTSACIIDCYLFCRTAAVLVFMKMFYYSSPISYYHFLYNHHLRLWFSLFSNSIYAFLSFPFIFNFAECFLVISNIIFNKYFIVDHILLFR